MRSSPPPKARKSGLIADLSDAQGTVVYADPGVWPHLPDSWMLRREPSWLAVDKPVECGEARGLAMSRDVHAASNALLPRLARAQGLLEPLPLWRLLLPSISAAAKPHLRDDASCSGVSVIGLTADAATQLNPTGAPPQQTWLVAVRGLPLLGSPSGEGLRAGLAALGVTLRERERRQDRVLLEVETDRQTDWPAELHRRGCPVVGLSRTRSQGPQPDHALMHRLRVRWPHLTLKSPVPPRFQCWLDRRDPPLTERLQHSLRRRYGLAQRLDTNAFRLFDDERGMTLDRYGADLVLSSYDALPDPLIAPERLADALRRARQRARQIGELLDARTVWLKLRPQQANHIVDAQKLGLVPTEPVYGQTPAHLGGLPQGETVVREGGVRYWVRLGDGLSTGIFLDQRDNRLWLRDSASDLRVLNTFSYTCAFSVAAAVGGARRTVSIDASAGALERGRANLALNDQDDPERHDTIRGDVFQWLPRMARRGDRFDIIILDPPSYAKVKKRRFSAAKDYPELVATAASLLAPGGTLLCCINHARVERRRLEQMVREGCRIANREVAGLRHSKPGIDHPSGRMKSLRARLN